MSSFARTVCLARHNLPGQHNNNTQPTSISLSKKRNVLVFDETRAQFTETAVKPVYVQFYRHCRRLSLVLRSLPQNQLLQIIIVRGARTRERKDGQQRSWGLPASSSWRVWGEDFVFACWWALRPTSARDLWKIWWASGNL